MEEKIILDLKKKAKEILNNIQIDISSGDTKLIIMLQEIEQKNIKKEELELLERTINNVENYFYVKRKMQLQDNDYNYLKEIATVLREQKVRIKDSVVYGEPVFEIKLGDGNIYYFITREGAKKFAETHSTMLEKRNESVDQKVDNERRKDNLMDVTLNKNLEIGRIIEIIKRNY